MLECFSGSSRLELHVLTFIDQLQKTNGLTNLAG